MPVVNGRRSDADPRRHDDFLERRVAGALADAVDRALDLPRAAGERGQRVGDREAEIVVAVRAQRHLVRRSARGRSGREERADFVGRRVADGVGQVDRLAPGRDHRLDDAAQEVRIAARRVLRRKLHVVGVTCARGGRPPPRRRGSASRVMRSLRSRWRSEVAMKTWMRRAARPARAPSRRARCRRGCSGPAPR